jgi:hypothetical protein
MKLRFKLILGFLVLSMMLFVAGAVSIWELKKIGSTVQRFLDENYRSITACKDMLESTERIDSGILLILTGSVEEGRSEINKGDSLFQLALDFAQSNITEAGENELTDKISTQFFEFRLLWDRVIVFTDDSIGIDYYHSQIHPVFLNLKNNIQTLMSLNDHAMYSTSLQLQGRIQRSVTPGIVAIIASIIFSIMWLYFLNKFFIAPIIHINRGIKSNMQYGKPYNVQVNTNDELEELNKSIDSILEK